MNPNASNKEYTPNDISSQVKNFTDTPVNRCNPAKAGGLTFKKFCENEQALVEQAVLDSAARLLKEGIEENFGVEVAFDLVIDGSAHYIGIKRTNSGKGIWYCGSWQQSKVKGHDCHRVVGIVYGQGHGDKHTTPISLQNQAVWELYLSQKGNADVAKAAKAATIKQAENRKIEEQRRLEVERKRRDRMLASVAYYGRVFDALPKTCTGEQTSYFAAKGLAEIEVMELSNIRYLHNCKYGSFALDRTNIPNLPTGTIVLARGTHLDGTNFYQELWPKSVIIQGERSNKNIIGSKKAGWIEITKPESPKQIIICEGVATALSLFFFVESQTLLIAAIDCNNLKEVANSLKSLLAKKGVDTKNIPVLFCADDDLHNVHNERIRKNTGLEGAKDASRLFQNSLVILPDFKNAGIDRDKESIQTIKAKYKDFNDLFVLPHGIKTIGKQIKQAFAVLNAKADIAEKVASKQLKESNLYPFNYKQKRLERLVALYKETFPTQKIETIEYIGNRLPNEFSQFCLNTAMQVANGEKRKTTIVVLSPMASGKTYQMARFFDLLKQDIRNNAIYISCLQSLCRDASNRGLGANYQDIKHARRQAQYTQDVPKYSSWCIPSLSEFASNFNLFPALTSAIIDETELVANFLRSKFDDKKNALQVLDKILDLANIAVFCDAYSNIKTLELVKQYRSNTDIIIVSLNQPNPAQKQAMIYPSKPAILLGIEKELQQGKKIYLATNNKKLAKDVAKTLEVKFGESKKILLIHAENTGGKNAVNQEQRAFLDNPNAEISKYEIVITSPVINSGFSIDNEKLLHIDSIYGIFCNTPNTSDPSSCLQQLARVRNPNSSLYHICIVGKNIDLEADIDAIQATYFKAYRYDKALWQLVPNNNKKGYPSYTIQDKKYESVLWRTLSDFAESKNKFFGNLLNCFALDNFAKYYCFAPNANDTSRENLEKDASERLKVASGKVKAEHIASVQSALKLSPCDYQTLSQKPQKTQEENYQLERYDIIKFYKLEDASPEDQETAIKFDLENDGRRKIHNWKVITSPTLEAFEALYKNASNVRTEHKANLWEARLLLGVNGLLPILGINARLELDESLTYTKHNKLILAYLQTLLDNYNAICKTLKLPSKAKLLNQVATNPLKAVGTILTILGLSQTRVNHRSKTYKIDSQSFLLWKGYLVKLGCWQDGNTAYIATLPSTSKPSVNIATTFEAIKALLTSKGYEGNTLLAQLRDKQITIATFFQLAINCFATRNGRFYQSLASNISGLINLFPEADWEHYLRN